MAKFRAIVNAVRQAITGNATTADVLSGKTFMSSASPNEQTGAMTNNGAVTASLTADGQVYTIPAGYHNGAGTVTANVLTFNNVSLSVNGSGIWSYTADGTCKAYVNVNSDSADATVKILKNGTQVEQIVYPQGNETKLSSGLILSAGDILTTTISTGHVANSKLVLLT